MLPQEQWVCPKILFLNTYTLPLRVLFEKQLIISGGKKGKLYLIPKNEVIKE
jgi:hypothetical protein